MIAFGAAVLSPEPARDATPSLLPTNWSITRTCPLCEVDWNTSEPCFCCGGAGTRVAYLPSCLQAVHRFTGHAIVHAHNPEEPVCPV